MVRVWWTWVVAALFFAACGGDGGGSCLSECGPGERRCSGGDSQLCEDVDGDGCLEWGDTQDCGARDCVQGWCVDPCTDQCSRTGDTRCDGDAVRTCRDTNGDGCLEWSDAVPCGTGESCTNGACTCSDECQTPGEKRCVGEEYQECGQFDGDECLEWSDEQSCPQGETCSNGECSDSCSDECAVGDRECAGNGYRVCGHYDADPCLDWSGVTDCAEHQSCEKGYCVGSCTNECQTSGARRCKDNGFQVCGNTDSDPCLEWGPVTDCKPGETCSNGVCSASCSDECSPVGDRECVSAYPHASYRECGEAGDGDSCSDWINHDCESDQTCSGGRCVPYCTDECTPEGSRRCAGDGYQVCVRNFDADSCLEWGGITSCTPQTCSNGQCVDDCSDECSAIGDRVCDGETGYRRCGQYDSDDCLDLSNTYQCASGTVCQDGQCVQGCSDECSLGDGGCSGDQTREWSCQDLDSDGCLDQVYIDCPAGEVCTTDHCQPESSDCDDDQWEDNDDFSSATGVGEGTMPSLQACADDPDYFEVYLLAGETLTADIAFTHADGDLDLTLYDAEGLLLRASVSTTDNESVSYTTASGGTFYIKAYGYNGAENAYSLTVAVEPAGGCTDDAYEENDTRATAAGVGEGDYAGLAYCDADFYRVAVADGETLDALLGFVHADGDLGLRLYDQNGTLIDESDGAGDDEMVGVTDATGGQDYVLEVFAPAGVETTYELLVTLTPGATCTDDGYEDNDDLAGAAMISEGILHDLQVCPDDPDYFWLQLAAGESIQADIAFIHAQGDLDLKLYDGGGGQVDASTSSTDGESVSYTTAEQDFIYVHVYGPAGARNLYDLTVQLEGGDTCIDDFYEENDSTADASAMAEGFYTDLRHCEQDPDYYEVYLLAGETLDATIGFTHANGNLDLKLWDAAGQELDASLTTTDDEHVQHTASSSGSVFIHVFSLGDTTRNAYDLDIAISPAASCTDDEWEENDSFADASDPVFVPGENQLTDLQVCTGDDDFYKFVMLSGESVTATITFTHAAGDLELVLYGPDEGFLDSSTSSENSETVEASGVAPGWHYLKVFGYDGAENAYDLTVTIVE